MAAHARWGREQTKPMDCSWSTAPLPPFPPLFLPPTIQPLSFPFLSPHKPFSQYPKTSSTGQSKRGRWRWRSCSVRFPSPRPVPLLLSGSKNEDMLKAIKEKFKEAEPGAPEPKPATEVLFLCSYQGCGKTFIDAGALKKHSHIHEEKQYVCHHEGCGRKFLDSSKLKRHFLIHSGERSFVCPHEGCGKAFSLDFNLKAHMRTHSQENYRICPYEDCGKRYAHEYKLRGHINAHHEKQLMRDVMKCTSHSERIHNAPKAPVVYATPTPERPYACAYGGCGKAYIHEYKLNLHLRREHPGHNAEETGKPTPIINADNVDGAGDYDGYPVHRDSGSAKKLKRNKPKLPSKFTPPTKVAKGKVLLSISSAYTNVIKPKYMPATTTMNEDDSLKTEERENLEEGWQNGDDKEDDGDTEY